MLLIHQNRYYTYYISKHFDCLNNENCWSQLFAICEYLNTGVVDIFSVWNKYCMFIEWQGAACMDFPFWVRRILPAKKCKEKFAKTVVCYQILREQMLLNETIRDVNTRWQWRDDEKRRVFARPYILWSLRECGQTYPVHNATGMATDMVAPQRNATSLQFAHHTWKYHWTLKLIHAWHSSNIVLTEFLQQTYR